MSKEFTRKMMDMVYDALELYIPTDPKNFKPELFSRESKNIVDVEAIIGDHGTEEDRADFFEYIGTRRLAETGLMYYGVLFLYDPITKWISAADKHICEVSVKDERNRPIAYISFTSQVREHCSDVQMAEKTAYCQSAHVVPAINLEDFMYRMPYVNLEEGKAYDHISTDLIRFSPDSINSYYTFTDRNYNTKCFVRMTKAMCESYSHSPYQDLCRETINSASNANEFGFNFAVWSYDLVNDSPNGVYLDEDINEKEVKFICSACEGTYLAQEVRRIFNTMKDNDGKDLVVQKFADNKDKIQTMVDGHRDEIFSNLLSGVGLPSTLDDNEETRKQLHAEAGKFGFDCGNVRFYFKDNALKETAKNAAVYGAKDVFNDGSFYVNLPYVTQSTTLQRIMADKVMSIAETEGIRLGCKTCLD